MPSCSRPLRATTLIATNPHQTRSLAKVEMMTMTMMMTTKVRKKTKKRTMTMPMYPSE